MDELSNIELEFLFAIKCKCFMNKAQFDAIQESLEFEAIHDDTHYFLHSEEVVRLQKAVQNIET